MEITEKRLYAAFGLDPDEGGKESDVAEQTTEEQEEQTEEETEGMPEGAEGSEPEPENEPEPDDDEEEEGSGEQSKEERRENAARRRQQETQEAIQTAVRQALAQQQAQFEQQQQTFFQQAGLVNPFNNKPITNMDEFREWRDEQDNQKLQKELGSGKLTRESLEKLIDRHPAVQAVRQAQEQGAQEAAREKDAAFMQNVEQQLAEIRKVDPAVKTVADLMNRPYSQAFYDAVKRGNNFVDAFYLATRDQMMEATAAAARQSAVKNATGKSHLKVTGVGGKAGATVTEDERKFYKLFNPDATDEDIQRYQNKYMKG